jgi:hypothetical protein
MHMFFCRFILASFLLLNCLNPFWVDASLSLRENMRKANKGDFIVTAQNKNYTLLHIYDKKGDLLTLEEITVPAQRIKPKLVWREWVQQRAPGHTSWILYNINLTNGQIQDCFSISKKCWMNISEGENFMAALLNLQFTPIPLNERRKVGPVVDHTGLDRRSIWQPKMIVDGKAIPGVNFNAWQTRWPNDGTELAGKIIDIYMPDESGKYPSYFPYWLQVKGAVGKANVRIVDAGSKLVSAAPPMPKKTLTAN